MHKSIEKLFVTFYGKISTSEEEKAAGPDEIVILVLLALDNFGISKLVKIIK